MSARDGRNSRRTRVRTFDIQVRARSNRRRGMRLNLGGTFRRWIQSAIHAENSCAGRSVRPCLGVRRCLCVRLRSALRLCPRLRALWSVMGFAGPCRHSGLRSPGQLLAAPGLPAIRPSLAGD